MSLYNLLAPLFANIELQWKWDILINIDSVLDLFQVLYKPFQFAKQQNYVLENRNHPHFVSLDRHVILAFYTVLYSFIIEPDTVLKFYDTQSPHRFGEVAVNNEYLQILGTRLSFVHC